MIVNRLTIETLPGRANRVAERITWGRDVPRVGVKDGYQLTAIWSGRGNATLEGFCEALLALDPDIVGVEVAPEG